MNWGYKFILGDRVMKNMINEVIEVEHDDGIRVLSVIEDVIVLELELDPESKRANDSFVVLSNKNAIHLAGILINAVTNIQNKR